jgi:hypothetical protein
MKPFNKFSKKLKSVSIESLILDFDSEHKAIYLLLMYVLIDCPEECPELIELLQYYVLFLPTRYHRIPQSLHRAVHDTGTALSGEAKHVSNGFASCTYEKEEAQRFRAMYCYGPNGGVLEVDIESVEFAIYIPDFIRDSYIEEFALTHSDTVIPVCGVGFDRYYIASDLIYDRVRKEREVFAVFTDRIIYLGDKP